MSTILYDHIMNSLDEAGNLLLEYFTRTPKITEKSDKSPVTEADLAVNDLICNDLKRYSDFKIVTEEQSLVENKKNAREDEFWIIDPLDGTKAFIRKEQDFAICVAKIKNNRPEFGFIHVPFCKTTYFSQYGKAYKKDFDGKISRINVRKKDIGLHILGSKRMSRNLQFESFVEKYDVDHISLISSAIKFCKVAEGEAQLYPYFADTMQWDSAAGEAIVLAAGGRVCDLHGKELFYGDKNDFLNPYFVAQA